MRTDWLPTGSTSHEAIQLGVLSFSIMHWVSQDSITRHRHIRKSSLSVLRAYLILTCRVNWLWTWELLQILSDPGFFEQFGVGRWQTAKWTHSLSADGGGLMHWERQTRPEPVSPMQNGEGSLTYRLVCISFELKGEWMGLEVNFSQFQ